MQREGETSNGLVSPVGGIGSVACCLWERDHGGQEGKTPEGQSAVPELRSVPSAGPQAHSWAIHPLPREAGCDGSVPQRMEESPRAPPPFTCPPNPEGGRGVQPFGSCPHRPLPAAFPLTVSSAPNSPPAKAEGENEAVLSRRRRPPAEGWDHRRHLTPMEREKSETAPNPSLTRVLPSNSTGSPSVSM